MGLIVLGVGDQGQRDETPSLCEGWVLGGLQPAAPPPWWLPFHPGPQLGSARNLPRFQA